MSLGSQATVLKRAAPGSGALGVGAEWLLGRLRLVGRFVT